MRLSDLRKQTRAIQIQYLGEMIEVIYLVNAVTPTFIADNQDVVSQVKAVVVEWDILDEEGKRIPPQEIVDALPLAFSNAVLNGIVEDMRSLLIEKKG